MFTYYWIRLLYRKRESVLTFRTFRQALAYLSGLPEIPQIRHLDIGFARAWTLKGATRKPRERALGIHFFKGHSGCRRDTIKKGEEDDCTC